MLATADPSFTRYWYLTIDDDIEGVTAAAVNKVISEVLSDPHGWRRMGYDFRRTTAKAAENRDPRTVFHIRLCKPRVVERVCDISDRSCAALRSNNIYLNSERWLHGSEKAGLSLKDYRKALVAHEVGHLLSFDHVKCAHPGSEGDVMQEFTRLGWGSCLPTVRPTLPRAWEPAISIPRRRSFRAGYRNRNSQD